MWQTIGGALQPLLSVSSYLLGPLRTAPKPVVPPTGFTPQPDTAFDKLDKALEELHEHKEAWTKVSCQDRAALLDVVLYRVGENLKAVSESAVKAKGSYGSGLGEEMQHWLPAIVELADLRQAMLEGGQPPPMASYTRKNGQHVAKVFPKGTMGLLFAGWSCEVWIQPDKEPTQGKLYRDKAAGIHKPGSVSLILGAGNQVTVVVADVLHKLIHEDEVVLVKMNPVNDFFGPHLEVIMQPLVDLGVLRFAYGGAAVGKYLVSHNLVDSVHMTGSVTTYNNIVWGAPVPPAAGSPVCSKPVSAELGNVTPYIVVPGPWSASDMEYHADVVVSGLLGNGGFNCCSLQVLITDKEWPLREEFLAAVRSALNATYRRKAWYPGSGGRFEAFKERFPEAESLGAAAGVEGACPALMVTGLIPDTACVDVENWVPVFQEVALTSSGGDASKFLAAAVDLANNRCWGTLAASVLIHPGTQAANQDAFDQALEDLAYGAVCVNAPAALAYGVPAAGWGAFPRGGNNPRDIGSGNCIVHNSSLFDHPDKSVVLVPWRVTPKPLWSATNTNLEALVPRVVDLMYSSNSTFISLAKIPLTALSALLG